MSVNVNPFIFLKEAMSGFEQFQKPAVYSVENHNFSTSAQSDESEPLQSLLYGPRLAKKIFRLGIIQLVGGVLMTCGMILYLGIILAEDEDYLSYTVAAIITATLVNEIAFEHILFALLYMYTCMCYPNNSVFVYYGHALRNLYSII